MYHIELVLACVRTYIEHILSKENEKTLPLLSSPGLSIVETTAAAAA